MRDKKDTVILLCTGNICRSPMAHALLERAVAEAPSNSPLSRLKVDSAGTGTVDGIPASFNSVAVLKNTGIDLSKHTSKKLTAEMLKKCFALVAMDESHLDNVRYCFPELYPERAFTILSLNPDSDSLNVPDPYGGDMREYEFVRDEIVSAMPHLVKYLENELSH